MCDPYSGFGLVDMLTACARCTENIDFKIGRIYLQLNFVCFDKDCNCNSRGVDSALRFGFGNTLNTVDSAFIFKS